MFDLGGEQAYACPMTRDNTNPIARLTDRQRQILLYIEECMRERGYPP